MILTDITILECIDKGEIVISPFNKDNLGTNSVDLTLNPKMLVYQRAEDYINHSLVNDKSGVIFIGLTADGNAIYKELYQEYHIDCFEKNETFGFTIPDDGFVLRPGQLYIASTNEYTETHNTVPKLEGKSSIGRLGLFVHVTAGYGDVGFCGTWTLELVATVPIKIYPNMKICQISYHSITEKPMVSYKQKESAKYSGQEGATASKNYENIK